MARLDADPLTAPQIRENMNAPFCVRFLHPSQRPAGIRFYLQRGSIIGKSDRVFEYFCEMPSTSAILFSRQHCFTMSSSAPALSPDAFPNQDVFFWIRPVDDRGFCVDPGFAEAAYEKARDFRLYRAQDLRDEAVRAELVERAVYAASRARKRDIIRDAKSYLFATFARLVDEHIKKDRGVEHKEPVEIDRYPGTIRMADSGSDIHDAILQQQLLEAMSPEDRLIWQRRLLGYEVNEIAAELNISPNCLSARIKRGIDDVRHILRSGRARQ